MKTLIALFLLSLTGCASHHTASAQEQQTYCLRNVQRFHSFDECMNASAQMTVYNPGALSTILVGMGSGGKSDDYKQIRCTSEGSDTVCKAER